MEKFNFRRRKCEVERYNRAKKLLNEITIQSLRAILEKEIAEYETKSEIINLFVNNPNLREEKDTDGTAKYTLPMRFVSFIDEKYQVVDGNIVAVGPGKATITVSFAGNNKYAAAE